MRPAWFAAAQAPAHWFDYERAAMVLLGQPDFDAMSHHHYQALRDYVQGGGTLVWLHPGSIIDAMATPLADLLPVEPLTLRRMHTAPELHTWARQHNDASADHAPRPQPATDFLFLDSVLRDHAVSALEQDETPWIAWKRFGAGQVGALMFDAPPIIFSDRAEGRALRAHLIHWSQRHPLAQGAVFAPALRPAAERLTGFRSVSAAAVGRIWLGYVVWACAILIVARYRRRDVVGWIILAGSGLVVTALVFHAAQRRMADHPDRSRIALSIVAPQAGRVIGRQYLTLFARQDATPHPILAADGVWLPPLFPTPLYITPGTTADRLTETLYIRRLDRETELHQFTLAALRPRSVGVAYAVPAKVTAGAQPVMAVGYDEQGPYVRGLDEAGWPDETRVYLTGAHAAQSLSSSYDGRWRPQPPQDRTTAVNPVIAAWENWLRAGHLPPGRVVRLYRDADATARWTEPYTLDGVYENTGYTLEIEPTVDLQPTGIVQIPANWIDLQPADHQAQRLLTGADAGVTTVAIAGPYVFHAHLPPLLANLHVKEIRVEAAGQDAATTDRLDVALQAYGADDHALQGIRQAPGVFVFDLTTANTDLVDPATGGFRVRLTARPAHDATGMVPARQSPLEYLRVSASGTPPDPARQPGEAP